MSCDDEYMKKLVKILEESNKKALEEANKKQTDVIKQHIRQEINILRNTFESALESKCREFEEKYNNLKDKYEKLEKVQRGHNIVIFGLPKSTENLPSYVVRVIKEYTELDITVDDIDNVYRIGKETNTKPIIVKFLSYLKKQEVIRRSKKFKGSKISISDDLTVEEREDMKVLRKHLQKARSENHNAFIRNMKLIVNGRSYTVQDLSDEDNEGVQGSTSEGDMTKYTAASEDQIIISENNTAQDLIQGKEKEIIRNIKTQKYKVPINDEENACCAREVFVEPKITRYTRKANAKEINKQGK